MLAIKKQREKSGLTQIELARLINVTQGAVSQWETGITKPSVKVLLNLSMALNCTVDELLRDDTIDCTTPL